MANYLDCKSVSVPAISSGIFGFPKDRCAQLMLENSIKWAVLRPGSVCKIYFCNFDAPTVSIFTKTLAKMIKK